MTRWRKVARQLQPPARPRLAARDSYRFHAAAKCDNWLQHRLRGALRRSVTRNCAWSIFPVSFLSGSKRHYITTRFLSFLIFLFFLTTQRMRILHFKPPAYFLFSASVRVCVFNPLWDNVSSRMIRNCSVRPITAQSTHRTTARAHIWNEPSLLDFGTLGSPKQTNMFVFIVAHKARSVLESPREKRVLVFTKN